MDKPEPFLSLYRIQKSGARNLLLIILSSFIVVPACSRGEKKHNPIQIEEQGSFAVGGTVMTSPGTFNPYSPTQEGETFHGDHAYVFYQVPVNASRYPLVMWHG